jgi:hypothetical protein
MSDPRDETAATDAPGMAESHQIINGHRLTFRTLVKGDLVTHQVLDQNGVLLLERSAIVPAFAARTGTTGDTGEVKA